VTGPVQGLGSRALALAETFGGLSLLSVRTLRATLEHSLPWRDLLHSIDHVGVRSASIVTLTALFTGLVLALQTGIGLQRFGSSEYTGYIVSLAIVRELGPVLTALIVGGRVAGGIAAELGSMAVTEQIDAIRAMGADPIRKLVVPRVLACMLTLPLLAIIADVLGILGSMLIADAQFGIPSLYFLETVKQSVLLSDVASGVSKTVFFGFAIGVIACYEGLNTTAGTVGVGLSTTRAVVMSSIAVLVLNFFLTKLFILL
jgi:phospholipid/cholesterol/gamma-HCH transport system permease protein